MQKYGILKDGQLLLSDVQLDGYKPVEYAEVPEFDQSTHYASQGDAVEYEDRIEVETVVLELDQQDAPIVEETVHEFVQYPPWKQVSTKEEVEILKARVKATNEYMDFLEEVVVEMAMKMYE